MRFFRTFALGFDELHVGYIHERLRESGAQREGHAGIGADRLQGASELLRGKARRRQSHQRSLLASAVDRNSDDSLHATRQGRATDRSQISGRGLSAVAKLSYRVYLVNSTS